MVKTGKVTTQPGACSAVHRSSHKRPPILVRASPLDRRRGRLILGGQSFACALGRGGIGAFKAEGDGATPIASMAILSGWRRADRGRRQIGPLPLAPILPGHGWCDAPRHGAYNRPVRLPFAASHETMARGDRLYDWVLVLDWNVRSRARHRGSAIFLHCAKPGYPPTEGCIALHPRDMTRLLPHLRHGRRIVTAR